MTGCIGLATLGSSDNHAKTRGKRTVWVSKGVCQLKEAIHVGCLYQYIGADGKLL